MENKYNEAIKMLQSARDNNNPFTLVITDTKTETDTMMLAAPIKATAYHLYNVRKSFKKITGLTPEQVITLDTAQREKPEKKKGGKN